MKPEEARRKAEVMLAFADGKEIEFFDEYIGDWVKADDPVFNWCIDVYRIKPKPTYRPFKDKEECWAEMQKHQPFGWVKHKKDGSFSCVMAVDDSKWYDTAYEKYNFADGTPFGIEVKE